MNFYMIKSKEDINRVIGGHAMAERYMYKACDRYTFGKSGDEYMFPVSSGLIVATNRNIKNLERVANFARVFEVLTHNMCEVGFRCREPISKAISKGRPTIKYFWTKKNLHQLCQ